MPQVATQNQTQTAPAERTLKDRFGDGRYFSIQCEVFKDTQRAFGLTEEKAEKVAKAIATKLGVIFSNRQVEIRTGRVDKNGRITIADFCKVKGLPLYNEVAMLRALDYISEAGSHHVAIVAKLNDDMQDWVNKL